MIAAIPRRVSLTPSMKAPPKRKGNQNRGDISRLEVRPSMKALPKRKGNWCSRPEPRRCAVASMKALPKRKGNRRPEASRRGSRSCLNESPSEKEGKYLRSAP